MNARQALYTPIKFSFFPVWGAAAAALRNTEDKTYLIARRCGYEDPNYFSYVFKRHFGMSPTKFRSG